MSLIKCKECNNEISSKAKTCPKCGAKNKRPSGCLNIVGGLFLGFIFVSVYFASNPINKNQNNNTVTTKNNNEAKIYNENQQVNIGYTSYFIRKSYYSNQLSDNQFSNDRPDGIFLFIDLSVINNDKEARVIPPFNLLDENNNKYEASPKNYRVKNAIGPIASLNPQVQKDGLVVFDVPKGKKYKLFLSGGYWSSEKALVNLNPK